MNYNNICAEFKGITRPVSFATARIFATTLLTMIIGLSGCSAYSEGKPDESTAIAKNEIRNPTWVSTDTRGLVRITNNYGSCSGTLLSSRWILTARHCVYRTSTGLAKTSPNAYVEFGTSPSNASWTVDRYEYSSSADAALVHLSQAAPVSVLPVYQNTPLYLEKDSSLVGSTLSCYGYGKKTDTDYYSNPLETANLSVLTAGTYGPPANVVGTTFVVLQQNTQNQILMEGDSGGPCFLEDPQGIWLASINSWGPATNAAYSYTVGAQQFRDWVWQTMGTPNGANTPDGFTYCATGENGACAENNPSTSFTRQVAYGANGKYTYKWVDTSFLCNISTFNNIDPIPNTLKSCYIGRRKAAWCAFEWGSCNNLWDDQQITYGAQGQYYRLYFPGVTWPNGHGYPPVLGTAFCSYTVFGDPFVGVNKSCFKSDPGYNCQWGDVGSGCYWGTGEAVVAYGANGQYIYKTFTNSVSCDYATFGGDPVPNVRKRCYIAKCSGCVDTVRY